MEPDSVHLCDFPQSNDGLIDQQLTDDMGALLKLATLGSAARNTVKIKVRQPLAELRVLPSTAAASRAVGRFADLLCDELNVRRVTLWNSAHHGQLLTAQVKPNMKSLAPKAGARLPEVKAAIEKLDATAGIGFPLELHLLAGPFTIDAADVIVTYQ